MCGTAVLHSKYTCPVLSPPETPDRAQGPEAFPLSLRSRPVTDSPKTITPAGHTDYAIATVGEESELPPCAGGRAHRAQRPGGSWAGKTCSVSKLCQGQVSRTVTSTSPATAPAVDVWEALVCGRQSRLMSKYSKDRVRVSCEAVWVFYPPICLYIRLGASAPGHGHHVIQDSCFSSPVPRPTVLVCALHDESLLVLPASEPVPVLPCLPCCS